MYYADETDLKPNKCGFFIFPERKESVERKNGGLISGSKRNYEDGS